MTWRRAAKPAILLAGVLTLSAIDCWEGETIVYQFQLTRCPDTSFTLPDTVLVSPFRFTVFPKHFPTCSGFTPYVVGQEPGPLDVRFNRGQSCTFDVAYTYLIAPGSPAERLRALEQQKRQRAETLIEAMAQTADRGPADLTMKELRFESLEALRDWCTLTAGEAPDSL